MRRSNNRLYALSVRKRNKPRLRLDLVFNLADLNFKCTEFDIVDLYLLELSVD